MEKKEREQQLAPSDEAVLAYLQKRGLIVAEKELKAYLTVEEQQPSYEKDKKKSDENISPSAEQEGSDIKSSTSEDELDESGVAEQFEKNEAESEKAQKAKAKEQFTFLYRSSGGGLGYDLDSASTLPTWGLLSLAGVSLKGVDEEMRVAGSKEAALYIESYTALQTWVLSLPDDPAVPKGTYSLGQQDDSTTATAATLIRYKNKNENIDNPMISLGKVRHILSLHTSNVSCYVLGSTQSFCHFIPTRAFRTSFNPPTLLQIQQAYCM